MESERHRWALWEACHRGDAKEVGQLLDAHYMSPNCTGPDGQANALMRAAMHGKAEVVRLLLQRGALPCWQSVSEMTALHYAVEGCHEDAVVELLRWGADPTIPDARGVTPLQEAQRRGSEPLVEVMEGALRPWTPGTHRLHVGRTRALAATICRAGYAVQRTYGVPQLLWRTGVVPFLRLERGATAA
eukprot:CAMPEP_0179166262 /NCGR_PEP_ID=MMETSP0796-20121207/81679_1 /TAXON_ID=73915 /ORGANISM="Pyrodinium bahamense, Strain pbaha01" /LENGTH=187 /DNA_ID=CAMNT_0020868847 /DNA_START=27 /DNA_END=590 /DNA_ORIENTATION=+